MHCVYDGYPGYSTWEEFDAGYSNSITPEVVARWEARFREASGAVLAARPDARSLRYGPGERNAIDFFDARGASGPAPLLVAIHGGLWFLFDKWMMHFLAEAFTRRGVHVACINYGLAPGQGLGGIVGDCRRAVAHLRREAGALNVDPARIAVLGHSAAGQLAALAAAPGPEPGGASPVRACIGVSGFYDIEPFAHTRFQEFVQFAPDDYRAWNPLRHVSPGHPPALLLTVGDESPLLQQMTARYAEALRGAGVPAETLRAEGECHFSVLRAVGDPASPLFARVLEAVAGS